MKRRDFGKSFLAGSAIGIAGCAAVTTKIPEYSSRGSGKSYGAEYYDKARAVWNRQSTTELPIISEAADAAAKTLKNGNKLYSHAMFGHMLTTELRVGRPGNPDYLPTWGWGAGEKEYDAIGKGDFLFFDNTGQRVIAARERGAFTVGVRIPYLPNKTTPKGVLSTGGNPLTEDCADLVLTSGIPFTNGALYYPEIPAVRPCPMSVQGSGIFYWMLSAEIAVRDKGGARMGSSGKALEYIKLIKKRGERIRADLDHIDTVTAAMVGYVSEGGRYWNYSHGCEMSAENDHRASGLPMSQSVNPDNVKAGDFAIVSGEHSDGGENLKMARKLKSKGVHIITIGPAQTEGSSGDDLSKISDWHIETYSPEREGALTVPGFNKKICPTTGILFALALWMMNAQFIARMIEADMTPGIDMGGHLIGGNGYNKVMRPIVKERGY